MKGCKFCPAYGKCTVIYRGSSCEAIRYSYGIDEDPEIKTNGDVIRAMTDEALAEFLCNRAVICSEKHCPGAELCKAGDGKANGLKKWLQQPAEE